MSVRWMTCYLRQCTALVVEYVAANWLLTACNAHLALQACNYKSIKQRRTTAKGGATFSLHDETHMDRCSKGWTEVKTINYAHNPEAECLRDRLVERS